MEILLGLFRSFLLPMIAEIVGDIFKKQSIDPEYVKKLIDASSQYKEAETHEEKKKARIAIIELTRK